MNIRARRIRGDEFDGVLVVMGDEASSRAAHLTLAEARDFAAQILVAVSRAEAAELVERAGDTLLGATLREELGR